MAPKTTKKVKKATKATPKQGLGLLARLALRLCTLVRGRSAAARLGS